MKKYVSELVGTAFLVLIGCGTAAIASEDVGVLGVAIAFGLAIVALAYSIGPISGGHVNPAVTLAAYITKRINGRDALLYVVSQVIGAFIAVIILMMLVNNPESGLGANFIFEDVTLFSAILFEVVFTFIFIFVILRVTKEENSNAGIVIGLTLVAIHLVGIKLTGTSLNPARSIAPALVGGNIKAMSDLWIFIIMPLVGSVFAAVFSNYLDQK
jgi:aquaporin Z